MRAKLVKRYWQLHSACATYAGGFLALILITGAFAVFAGPIYNWEFRSLTHVEPAQFRPEILPRAIAEASERLEAESVKPSVMRIYLPQEETDPVRIEFMNTGHKAQPFVLGQPWLIRSAIIHPETGNFIGEVADDRSIAFYLRFIHVRLFAGSIGRNFVGLFGIALFVISLSGILILSKFLGKKALWLIRRNSVRNVSSDTHKLIGFALLVPAMVFAVTGFWLGMQGRLMEWFNMERPEAYEREALIEPHVDEQWDIDFALALQKAKTEHPALIPQIISYSTDGQRTVRIQGRLPGTVYERYSQGVVMDKAGYEPLKVINTPEATWQETLFYLQEAIHFGDFAGSTVRVIYLIIGILLGILPITGYLIRRLRARESLRGFYLWTAFVIAYAIGSLALLKTQGVIVVASYGTVGLAAFVIGICIFWIWRGISASKQRNKADS